MGILQAVGIGKQYNLYKGFLGVFRPPLKRVAVDGVSLAIEAGEIVGLEGPNGAGKTTLLKMLSGLLSPTTGKVLLEGKDVSTSPQAVAGRIRIAIADARSFYWRLTCAQNLDFFAALGGLGREDRKAAVARTAEAMGLTDRLNDRFFTLSSGLMQRMALARAMLVEGDVWLLDEPTKDLDAASRDSLFRLIRQWQGRGNAVVLASHAPGDLDALCTRVLGLQGGRLVTSAPAVEEGP
jgi:ABC-2 type transport system ATP-binding protein